MKDILLLAEVIVAVLLVVAILLQSKDSSGMGSLGGDDSVADTYSVRRGAEKVLYQVTIALAVIFALIALLYPLFS